jgi:hypothetical protein
MTIEIAKGLRAVLYYQRTFVQRNTGERHVFSCANDGRVSTDDAEYQKCMTPAFYDAGVIEMFSYGLASIAIGHCFCGAEIVLDGSSNTCKFCWSTYNEKGEFLAPEKLRDTVNFVDAQQGANLAR